MFKYVKTGRRNRLTLGLLDDMARGMVSSGFGEDTLDGWACGIDI